MAETPEVDVKLNIKIDMESSKDQILASLTEVADSIGPITDTGKRYESVSAMLRDLDVPTELIDEIGAHEKWVKARPNGTITHQFFKQIEAPITDELIKRIKPNHIKSLIQTLLRIGVMADTTKREIFYGTTIRPIHSAEYNALEHVAQYFDLYPIKFEVPPLESLPPEIRHDLTQRIRRLHHTLGLLSEIFEAVMLDTVTTNALLAALTIEKSENSYGAMINDVKNSFDARHKAEVKSATAKDDAGLRKPEKEPELYDLQSVISEEGGDMSYYLEGLVDTVGLTLDEVRHRTYDKLNKRYHQGQFSQTQAETRADKQEQEQGKNERDERRGWKRKG